MQKLFRFALAFSISFLVLSPDRDLSGSPSSDIRTFFSSFFFRKGSVSSIPFPTVVFTSFIFPSLGLPFPQPSTLLPSLPRERSLFFWAPWPLTQDSLFLLRFRMNLTTPIFHVKPRLGSFFFPPAFVHPPTGKLLVLRRVIYSENSGRPSLTFGTLALLIQIRCPLFPRLSCFFVQLVFFQC